LLGVLMLVGLLSGLELLKPWPFKYILDDMLGGRPPASGAVAGIVLWCLAFVGIAAASAAVVVAHNYASIGLGQRMVSAVREDLYRHLQRLSLGFHARQTVGDLLYRVTADSFAIQTLTMNALLPALTAVVMLSGMAFIMYRLDPALTLIALVTCPVLMFVTFAINRRVGPVALQARHAESTMYAMVQRAMSSIRVIQAFATEETEQQRFAAASDSSLAAKLKLYTLQTACSGLVSIMIAIGMAMIIGVGALHVLAGTLTVGELVLFSSYLASLYGPVNSIVQGHGVIQDATAGVQRVFEILETEPEVVDGTVSITAARGTVTFENVGFEYRPGEPVLHDIRLDVAPGETVAVVGSTGAGKSTLMSLLPRFYDPSRGRVLLDGRDVREYRLKDLRRQISLVLQPPLVFPLTMRENIAYGQPDAGFDAVIAAAKSARIHEVIERLPAGYNTVLEQDGVALSEGERQRLTIARALLKNAPVLILDEPTSSVDLETERMILQSLAELRRGRTCFIIAHRLSTIREADQIIVVERGRIVERGQHAALLAQHGRYAALYGHQDRAATEAYQATVE
jgi:ATP-binding cassette subfamily B protein/subfamily B ATP-binding cassette protein MsbA